MLHSMGKDAVGAASGDSGSKRVHSEIIDLDKESESDRDAKKRRVESALVEDSTMMVLESEAIVDDIEIDDGSLNENQASPQDEEGENDSSDGEEGQSSQDSEDEEERGQEPQATGKNHLQLS